jgi:hypothetical protein
LAGTLLFALPVTPWAQAKANSSYWDCHLGAGSLPARPSRITGIFHNYWQLTAALMSRIDVFQQLFGKVSIQQPAIETFEAGMPPRFAAVIVSGSRRGRFCFPSVMRRVGR